MSTSARERGSAIIRRLTEAIAAASGVLDRGDCRHCEEDVTWNGIRRQEAAYYLRMAVGLRLAQVTAMRDKAIAREALMHRAGLDVTDE